MDEHRKTVQVMIEKCVPLNTQSMFRQDNCSSQKSVSTYGFALGFYRQYDPDCVIHHSLAVLRDKGFDAMQDMMNVHYIAMAYVWRVSRAV